ncbi:MAG: tol-pal system protein YbgF [Alphaproteobacteria bacterium]
MAQSARDMNNRLSRIENEIETLSRAVYRGEQPPAAAVSRGGDAASQGGVEIRLQQMERELQDMRGKLEEQAYETRRLREELERVTGDLEVRIGDLEGGRSSSSAGSFRSSGTGAPYTAQSSSAANSAQQPPQPAANSGYQWTSGNQTPGAENSLGTYVEPSGAGRSASAASQAADPATASYENAFALLKNSQYDAAEKEFQDFVNRYPTHALAGNARYWLGETFYVRGNFERAARIFAEAYQKDPKGQKAGDNLLKLGMSLAGMGNKDDACVALDQLGKDGVSAPAPVLRRADQERSRLNCS